MPATYVLVRCFLACRITVELTGQCRGASQHGELAVHILHVLLGCNDESRVSEFLPFAPVLLFFEEQGIAKPTCIVESDGV